MQLKNYHLCLYQISQELVQINTKEEDCGVEKNLCMECCLYAQDMMSACALLYRLLGLL